jgi:hypothetical protein
MGDLAITVNGGDVLITGNDYQVAHVQSAIRTILRLDPSVDISTVTFRSTGAVSDLNPRQRSIVHLLLPDVPADAPFDALKGIPALALDLLESASSLKVPPPTSFSYGERPVPLPIAAFLVEIFGAYQDRDVAHRINKRFNTDPIFTLLLPIPVPVKFRLAPNAEVLLSVAESAALPASRALALLESAILWISGRPFKTITFRRVDIEGFDSDKQSLFSRKNNVALVKGDDDLHPDESRTFTWWVTPLGGPFPDKFDDVVEREYFPINRRECAECHKPFSDVSNEPCVQNVHAPDCVQLPFEDGSLERFDPEEQQTFVRWSCCPEDVPIDENGCLEVIVNSLHLSAGDVDLSLKEIVDGAVFLRTDSA